jgi:hypothetical protein
MLPLASVAVRRLHGTSSSPAFCLSSSCGHAFLAHVEREPALHFGMTRTELAHAQVAEMARRRTRQAQYHPVKASQKEVAGETHVESMDRHETAQLLVEKMARLGTSQAQYHPVKASQEERAAQTAQ